MPQAKMEIVDGKGEKEFSTKDTFETQNKEQEAREAAERAEQERIENE